MHRNGKLRTAPSARSVLTVIRRLKPYSSLLNRAKLSCFSAHLNTISFRLVSNQIQFITGNLYCQISFDQLSHAGFELQVCIAKLTVIMPAFYKLNDSPTVRIYALKSLRAV